MKNKILNLTIRRVCVDQIAAGVFDPDESVRIKIRNELTFTNPPTVSNMELRAMAIVVRLRNLLSPPSRLECTGVMINGPPYFMPYLHTAIRQHFSYLDIFYPFYKLNCLDKAIRVNDKIEIHEKRVLFHDGFVVAMDQGCLLYTSPSPRD